MSIHWWPRILLQENRALIDRINRRLGYRLLPTEVSWPRDVTIGEPFRVRWTWSNLGVAPCYGGGFPALTLKDDKEGIVSVLSDERLNLRDLKTGPPDEGPTTPHKSTFIVGLVAPHTAPGAVAVFVSVGAREGTPRIALPLSDHDGQRRYRLGTLTLHPPKPGARKR